MKSILMVILMSPTLSLAEDCSRFDKKFKEYFEAFKVVKYYSAGKEFAKLNSLIDDQFLALKQAAEELESECTEKELVFIEDKNYLTDADFVD